MPLTLITGPANAAKAGAVLERLRAALAREPVLVVPTSADATHYARELARAGLVFGAEVTTFPWLMRELARAAGDPRKAARPARPRAGRPRRDHATWISHALGPSSAGPGVRRGARRPVRRAPALARAPGALRRRGRLAAAGRRRPRRGARARCTPPTTGGWRRSRRSTSTASRTRALNAARDGLGRPPAVPLRLRRAAARPSSTSWRRSPATPTPTSGSRSPTSRAAPRWRAAPRRSSCSSRSRASTSRSSRARSTTRRAPAARCTTSSASCSSPPAGVSAQRRRPAARGRRRARRGRARRRLGARAAARRDGAPRTSRCSSAAAARDLFAQVFEGYGIPVARERRTPFAQTRLGTGVLAFARAALGGTAQDVVTWLRTPGKLDARLGPPSSPTGSRSRSAATRRVPPATRAGIGRSSAGAN